jgi:hypothetical protein
MNEVPLFCVYTYNDVDRAFWETHLEGWVPRKLMDAHVHIVDPAFQIEPLTEELRRSYWVMELLEMQSAETADRCIATVFPGRDVRCLGFGFPSLDWDVEGSNDYVFAEMVRREWNALALVCPSWTAEYVDGLLARPGVLGVKPYYQMIGRDVHQRDRYIEASIFDFLPHHQLEVLDARGAWVTLHVPRSDRLGHPDNIREIKELRRRYPNIVLVIAHLGRSYTLPHAVEGLAPLADDPGLYFDNSAVLNAEVHRFALKTLGPERILYGTDNPVFYMRGRRQYHGTTYINRTSHPFYFNKDRESPEIEAQYTLYMYEALRALKWACEMESIASEQVRAIFHDNARGLMDRVLNRKGTA